MTMYRRATDAAAHAHRRADDAPDAARMHLRTDDPPLPRFEWRTPPELERAPRAEPPRRECEDSCALGAFVGALAGCFLAGLVVAGILMLGDTSWAR